MQCIIWRNQKIKKENIYYKINGGKLPIENIVGDNNCTICKDSILINMNCNNKYNHYYCGVCINKWYFENNNELKCLLGYNE